jgi:hypothetical protein
MAKQPIADVASDHERASAVLFDQPRNGDRLRQNVLAHVFIVLRLEKAGLQSPVSGCQYREKLACTRSDRWSTVDRRPETGDWLLATGDWRLATEAQ